MIFCVFTQCARTLIVTFEFTRKSKLLFWMWKQIWSHSWSCNDWYSVNSILVPFRYFTRTVSMGNPFFPLHWSLFQSCSYNCTWLVRVRWKKLTNPRRWRVSLWLCRPPYPPKMGGTSGYISRRLPPYLRFLLFSDEDPSSLTLRRCRDQPLKRLSSRIRTSFQTRSSPAVIR